MGNLRNDFPTYIGTSKDTPEEQIKKLKQFNLPIFFYDDEDGSYYDEVGGFHSAAVGWNPNGVWCGECTNRSCKDCPSRYSEEKRQ